MGRDTPTSSAISVGDPVRGQQHNPGPRQTRPDRTRPRPGLQQLTITRSQAQRLRAQSSFSRISLSNYFRRAALELLRERLRWLVVLCDGVSKDPILVPSGEQQPKIQTRHILHARQTEQDALNEFAGKSRESSRAARGARSDAPAYHQVKLAPPSASVAPAGQVDQVGKGRRRRSADLVSGMNREGPAESELPRPQQAPGSDRRRITAGHGRSLIRRRFPLSRQTTRRPARGSWAPTLMMVCRIRTAGQGLQNRKAATFFGMPSSRKNAAKPSTRESDSSSFPIGRLLQRIFRNRET